MGRRARLRWPADAGRFARGPTRRRLGDEDRLRRAALHCVSQSTRTRGEDRRRSNVSTVRRVADHYSLDAESYEEGWAPVLLPHGRELLDRLPLEQSRRVLDAGAGVGTLLPEIQRRARQATVIGIDCSAGMIARAPDPFPRAVMDVTRLGFAPSSF